MVGTVNGGRGAEFWGEIGPGGLLILLGESGDREIFKLSQVAAGRLAEKWGQKPGIFGERAGKD